MIKDKDGMIAIWIGTSNKPFEEWKKYHKGIEKPKSKRPIHKDLNCAFIDVDFFGAFATEDNSCIPVEELVKNAFTYSAETNEQIVQLAHEKGITEGNRMYQYMNVMFVESKENKNSDKKYNDLTFIGNFKNPKPKK